MPFDRKGETIMAKLCKEIHATVADKVGLLADATDKVKAAGVNITGLCAWVEGDKGHLRMLTEDNDKVCQAISPLMESCEMDEAVAVRAPNSPGALNEIARKLADSGININLVYATAEGNDASIVLKTTDNAKAAEIL